MNGSCLAMVDADKIHDYVFSPHQLKLIRGGSAVQAEVNEKEILKLLGKEFGPGNLGPELEIREEPSLERNPSQRWEAIFAGGGTTLVEFRTVDDGRLFCRLAADEYRVKTVAGTATSAVAEWQGDFRTTLEEVQRALELNKSGRSELAFNGSAPYWKVCEACGGHPATGTVREADGTEAALCAACQVRRENSARSPYLDEVARRANRKLTRPKSFEDLAKAARPENYLAMVYVDLDRLGRYLHKKGAGSKRQYRELSHKVGQTVRDGVIRGCAEVCRRIEAECAAFEILLIGGDDAMVMLPAQGVIPFLEKFNEHFGSQFDDVWYSAGVMWAHAKYPIAQFRQRAEELLRSAKGLEGVNSVDYMLATEAMVADLQEVRERASGDGLERTTKPYSVGAFLELENTIRQWKKEGVPSSKVQELYRIAYEPWEQSLLDYWFLFSRLTKAQQEEFRTVFRWADGMWEPSPARRTQAADLAELWDMVEAR